MSISTTFVMIMRQLTKKVDELDFNRLKGHQLFGDLYAQMLLGLQSAGNGGEYSTIHIVAPLLKCGKAVALQ